MVGHHRNKPYVSTLRGEWYEGSVDIYHWIRVILKLKKENPGWEKGGGRRAIESKYTKTKRKWKNEKKNIINFHFSFLESGKWVQNSVINRHLIFKIIRNLV